MWRLEVWVDPSFLSSLIKGYKSFSISCFVPDFKVLKEDGPPHMKSFVVCVTVGEFAGEGEGKSKKIAKKLAAAAVLGELKRLPHIASVEKTLPRIKKKTKSIIKVMWLVNGNKNKTSIGLKSLH